MVEEKGIYFDQVAYIYWNVKFPFYSDFDLETGILVPEEKVQIAPEILFHPVYLFVEWEGLGDCKHLPQNLAPSQVALVVKKLPVNVGDARDSGSIPESERTLEKEMATHSTILAWRIPWTEEPDGQQSMGSQRIRHNWATKHTGGIYNVKCFN